MYNLVDHLFIHHWNLTISYEYTLFYIYIPVWHVEIDRGEVVTEPEDYDVPEGDNVSDVYLNTVIVPVGDKLQVENN